MFHLIVIVIFDEKYENNVNITPRYNAAGISTYPLL